MSFGKRAMLLAGVSVLAASILDTGSAQAQQGSSRPGGEREATEVGEVLVTARKREERLRDVPVAASVLDVEGLQARGGEEEGDADFIDGGANLAGIGSQVDA